MPWVAAAAAAMGAAGKGIVVAAVAVGGGFGGAFLTKGAVFGHAGGERALRQPGF